MSEVLLSVEKMSNKEKLVNYLPKFFEVLKKTRMSIDFVSFKYFVVFTGILDFRILLPSSFPHRNTTELRA